MSRANGNYWTLIFALATLWRIWSGAAPAAAADPEPSRADVLAAAIYFESIPFELASDLSEVEVARLIELLDDPASIRQHSNILVALGMSGSAAAFPAISDYAQRGSSAELDRFAFRAQRSIPIGMGHLARVDERALAWLIRAALETGTEPRRSFRQIDSNRVADLV